MVKNIELERVCSNLNNPNFNHNYNKITYADGGSSSSFI